MRVIAGSVGGRKLIAPDNKDTRPTGDRVREATCNALVSLGAIEDARVLDLFAGTGALGIEALSRGAVSATFVDNNLDAFRSMRTNLEACRFTDMAKVVNKEVMVWLRAQKAASSEPLFTLAFCDPPYVFDAWDEVLTALAKMSIGTVVAERNAPLVLSEELAAIWNVVRERKYGTTVVSILELQESYTKS